MKSFRFSPGKSKHNKFFRLATSAIAALALAAKPIQNQEYLHLHLFLIL
jgi:hypothetical protein